MAELTADNITVRAGSTSLVDDVSFTLRRGEFAVLLGPNGAGKTTLLRAALGLEKLSAGHTALDGVEVSALAPAARARSAAYLPQKRPLAWPARVRDVVALGRFSHGGVAGRLTGPDAEAVSSAMNACDLEHLGDRSVDTLSGGEQARMHVARALAAEAPLLVADEPTAALDPRHQFRTLDLIHDFVAKGGGALVVLHDVQLAARYASRLIWMKGGRVVADGPPAQTLTGERLEDIYGVPAHVEELRVEWRGSPSQERPR